MFILLAAGALFCLVGGIAVALYLWQLGSFLIPGMLLAFACTSAAVLCGWLSFGWRRQSGRRGLSVELLPLIFISGLFMVSSWVALTASTSQYRIEGHAMMPTLSEGTFVLADEWAYRYQLPERGDIVVFRLSNLADGAERLFMKRVVGLPGERVITTGGQVSINGAPLDEPYLGQVASYTGSWVVGPNDYFLLGDYRNQSHDSHNYGPLPLSEIIGRVSWHIAPEWGRLERPVYTSAYP
jgi:signal peptidase I